MRNRDGNIIDKGFNNIGVHRPTTISASARATRSARCRSHAGALPRRCRRRTFDGAHRDEGLRRGWGVQGAVAAQRGSHGAVLPQRRCPHAAEVWSSTAAAATWRRQALDGTPIEPLGVPALTSDEIDALVAFLETLTDERVVYGARRSIIRNSSCPTAIRRLRQSTDANGDGLADDVMVEIPAVGAAGGPPLPGFLEGVFSP